jgi:hypothetical protein
MKKFLVGILAGIFCFGSAVAMTGCDVTAALDLAFENECLIAENEELAEKVVDLTEKVKDLEVEVATLKFEAAFEDRIVTESCILNKVEIVNKEVKEDGSVWAVRADGAEVEVTINDGVYDAGSGSLYNIAIWAHNGAKVVINNGVFKTGADVNGEANHVIYAAGNSIIEINGGWFESVGIDAPMLLNCQDGKGTIIVKGGTFVNFDPSNCVSEGEGTSFVPEGYVVVKETREGIDYYTVVKAPVDSGEEEVEPEVPAEGEESAE